ncbi:MAG: formylglycine-generating enzyme family protein, partial [Candidatus Methylomirabilaceae bacterium]
MTRRRFLEGIAAFGLSSLVGQASADGCRGDKRLAVVPAGPFWMGSDSRERAFAYRIGGGGAKRNRWFDDELPRAQVTLGAYAIDRYLVTNEDYQRFVQHRGDKVPFITEDKYVRQGYAVHPYERVKRYLWHDGRYPEGRGGHPVVLVSVADARAYAEWRSQKEGRRFRLPTEAEWEKAARGTDGRYFPWGDRWRPDLANAEYRVGDTTEVGSYPKGVSPYGCFDMAGNVFEWTSSEFSDGKAVMKGGGSWDDQPGMCRAAARHGRVKEARHILIGFRCVCGIEESATDSHA